MAPRCPAGMSAFSLADNWPDFSGQNQKFAHHLVLFLLKRIIRPSRRFAEGSRQERCTGNNCQPEQKTKTGVFLSHLRHEGRRWQKGSFLTAGEPLRPDFCAATAYTPVMLGNYYITKNLSNTPGTKG